MPTSPVFLNTGQVARIYQKSAKTIRRWAREGVLPGSRVGGQWYFHADVIRSRVNRGQEAQLDLFVDEMRRSEADAC